MLVASNIHIFYLFIVTIFVNLTGKLVPSLEKQVNCVYSAALADAAGGK